MDNAVAVPAAGICFCTLAINTPYHWRAKRLIEDAPDCDWVVLTDDPGELAGARVSAIEHAPTGPMAVDYLERLPATGNNRGAAAYHDKRFVFARALERFDSAIFLDADSRLADFDRGMRFPPGLAVAPLVKRSIREHLEQCGSWRLPAFRELAIHLVGSDCILDSARWCHESLMVVTRDGRESEFVEVWGRCADFMQQRGVFSGEGGVIGLAAQLAGWQVDFESTTQLWAAISHEGGGPKRD